MFNERTALAILKRHTVSLKLIFVEKIECEFNNNDLPETNMATGNANVSILGM